MGFLDAANHLLNFLAPAMAVALLVAMLAQIFKPNKPLAQYLIAQAAINFVACSAVLAAGLWFFGRDGKMATYVAMVLVSASVQWVLLGSWRK
jgi:FtsH-binding integral membrane protein